MSTWQISTNSKDWSVESISNRFNQSGAYWPLESSFDNKFFQDSLTLILASTSSLPHSDWRIDPNQGQILIFSSSWLVISLLSALILNRLSCKMCKLEDSSKQFKAHLFVSPGALRTRQLAWLTSLLLNHWRTCSFGQAYLSLKTFAQHFGTQSCLYFEIPTGTLGLNPY